MLSPADDPTTRAAGGSQAVHTVDVLSERRGTRYLSLSLSLSLARSSGLMDCVNAVLAWDVFSGPSQSDDCTSLRTAVAINLFLFSAYYCWLWIGLCLFHPALDIAFVVLAVEVCFMTLFRVQSRHPFEDYPCPHRLLLAAYVTVFLSSTHLAILFLACVREVPFPGGGGGGVRDVGVELL